MQLQGILFAWGSFSSFPFSFAGSKKEAEGIINKPAFRILQENHVVKRLGFKGRAFQTHLGSSARVLCAHGPAAQLLKARRPMRASGGAPPAVPLKRRGWSC